MSPTRNMPHISQNDTDITYQESDTESIYNSISSIPKNSMPKEVKETLQENKDSHIENVQDLNENLDSRSTQSTIQNLESSNHNIPNHADQKEPNDKELVHDSTSQEIQTSDIYVYQTHNKEQTTTNNNMQPCELDINETQINHKRESNNDESSENELIVTTQEEIPQEILYENASSTQNIMQEVLPNSAEKKNNTPQEENPFLHDIDSKNIDSHQKIKKAKKQKKVKQRKYNWNYILYSKRLFVSIALLACFVGLYAGYLVFGSTSFEVLWRLSQTKSSLQKEVEEQRVQNATLQRKVLELKALEPK